MPPAEAVHENDRVLGSVPAFPGAKLEGRADNEGLQALGGKGAESFLWYRTNDVDEAAIVEHYTSQLDGWTLLKEESFPNGKTATFVRGDAYFQVSARGTTDAGEGPFPGYAVRVDARDAKVAPWIRKLVNAPSTS